MSDALDGGGAGGLDLGEDLDDVGDLEAADQLDPHELEEFVDAYVVPWARERWRAGTGLWCDRWAEHVELFPRLNDVVLAREPTGDPEASARWWSGIFDPFLDRLVALDGPFRSCQAGHLAGTAPARFSSAADWFDGWFAQVLTRRIPSDMWWCPGWEDHPEVVLQVTALWAAWERSRASDPAAMVGWWDTAERVLGRLCAPGGPFAACKTNRQTHVGEWVTLTGVRVTSGR